MRRAGNGGDRESGFTLLEVLVALVITIAAVALLYTTTASLLRTAHTSASWRQAISRAQSRLSSVTDPGRELGHREGDDGDGYHWTTTVNLASITSAPPGTRPGPWARGTALYAVTVTMAWRDGRAMRDFALNSAVLGPVPGAGP